MTASHTQYSRFHSLFLDETENPMASFNEVKAAIDNLPTPEQRGAAFEAFSTAILATDVRINAKHVYRVSDAPAELLRTFGIELGADNGIDLLIVDSLDRVIAVQQKFHLNPEENVVYGDLPTFFQQATNIPHLLIATTAQSVNIGNKRVTNIHLPERQTLTVLDLDSHLELTPAQVEEAICWLQTQRSKPSFRYIPHPHQNDAVRDLSGHLAHHNRATHHSACGTGKTLVSALVGQKVLARGGLVLVMEPTLCLIKQNLATWATELSTSEKPYSFLVACSDQSIMGPDKDDILPTGVGFPVTTDAETVRSFLKRKREKNELRIVFSTYQSSGVIEEALNGTKIAFDFANFDEAHRMVVNQATDGTISDFARPLYDNRIPIRKRLFQTATLKNVRMYGQSSMTEVEVVSMDRENLFGDVAHTLSFGEAAERGIIRKPKFLVFQINKEDLPCDLRSLSVRVGNDRLNGLIASQLVCLDQALEISSARKVITFHKSKRAADVFAKLAEKRFSEFKVASVHSGQSSRKRLAGIKLLDEDGNAIVTNVRCLTEGMDAPATDLVVVLSESSSEIELTQIIGRCVRKSADPSITHGYVALPLIISESEDMNPENIKNVPGMRTYRQVLQVLLSINPEFHTDYFAFRRAVATKDAKATKDARTKMEEHINFIDFSDEMLANFIKLSAFEPLEMAFWDNLAILKTAVEVHGIDKIGRGFVSDCGVRIGDWLSHQKAMMLSGRMAPDREEALRELGVNPSSNDERFEQGLALLRAFVKENGHAKVPANGPHHSLRVWIASRRRDFNAGKLAYERLQAIEALGISFTEKKLTRFEEGIPYLEAYVRDTGNMNVSGNYVCEDGFELGVFATKYLPGRKRKGNFTEQERQVLSKLGFEKKACRIEIALSQKLAMFTEIIAEHGSMMCETINDNKYPRWRSALKMVKAALRENRVPEELRVKFQELGISEPVNLKVVRQRMRRKPKTERKATSKPFDDFIKLLRAYIRAGGSPNAPQTGPDSVYKGVRLGNRLNTWLKLWRAGELSEKQVGALVALGVVKYRTGPKGKATLQKAA